MSRFTIHGDIDIAPGASIRFEDPVQHSWIEVTREHDLPLTDVLAGGPIGRAYTSCVHPTFLAKTRVWQHTDAWFAKLLDHGVRTIRGAFNPGSAGSRRVLELCIASDVKWIATIVPEDGYDWTKDQVQDRARAVKAAIAQGARIDVELMNEPDTRRSANDPPVPADWPAIMVRHAQWIREILPDVWIVSCSLHAGTDSFERDWQRLGAAGLGPLINSIGLHDYDNGLEPCQATDWRIDVARAALGEPNKPVDVTEYGHTISVNNPQAERNPTSVEAARAYAWRGHFDRVITRGIRHAARFELLCDPDPQRRITEAGFGIIDCPTLDPITWRDLPEGVEVSNGLRLLHDDLGFTPAPIRLKVDDPSGQVRHVVTQTSGRPPYVWIWRPDSRVWDSAARTDLPVDPVAVTVTTEHMTRHIDVTGDMEVVELTEYAA